MSDVIRAWKDPKYRASLGPEELADLPAHPAGANWSALDNGELRSILGGASDAAPIDARSGGYVCTLTTECPWFSFCCRPV